MTLEILPQGGLLLALILDCLKFLVPLTKCLSPLGLPLLRDLRDLIKVVFKPLELRTCYVPSLDEEGEWQHFKRVLAYCSVVLSHIDEHPLLVGELFVLLHFVIQPQSRWVSFVCCIFLGEDLRFVEVAGSLLKRLHF